MVGQSVDRWVDRPVARSSDLEVGFGGRTRKSHLGGSDSELELAGRIRRSVGQSVGQSAGRLIFEFGESGSEVEFAGRIRNSHSEVGFGGRIQESRIRRSDSEVGF